MFKVVISGCPNSGKSLLFNRLAKKNIALVNDAYGVTRDRNEVIVEIDDIVFTLIDTAGYCVQRDALSKEIMKQTLYAIQSAQLLLFVVDLPVTEYDRSCAQWLRKNSSCEIVLVINKCDRKIPDSAYELGFKSTIYVSAAHNSGMAVLYEYIFSTIKQHTSTHSTKPMRFTITGRPNVGKSTFINQLLQQERVIVDNAAGTTRDAIQVAWQYKNRDIALIDTAGMRKKSQVNVVLEKSAVSKTVQAIRDSHITILMLDSNCLLAQQELAIASLVLQAGKGLVIVINKWDLLQKKDESQVLRAVQLHCVKLLSVTPPIIPLTAIKSNNCSKVIDECIRVYDKWQTRLITSQLNKWLQQATIHHSPGLEQKKPIRLKYITQVATCPPSFLINANVPVLLNNTYYRYLRNSLQKHFALHDIVIRLSFKKNYNPYI